MEIIGNSLITRNLKCDSKAYIAIVNSYKLIRVETSPAGVVLMLEVKILFLDIKNVKMLSKTCN